MTRIFQHKSVSASQNEVGNVMCNKQFLKADPDDRTALTRSTESLYKHSCEMTPVDKDLRWIEMFLFPPVRIVLRGHAGRIHGRNEFGLESNVMLHFI